LVGLQGAGKTTTAIKLALLARREGHKPMLVALDQRRPAAVEQLRVLAAKDSVEFATGIGPAVQVALTAIQESMTKSCDFVILDTAGRQQLDPDLMEELRQLRSALPITEVLLVADAMTGQEAVNVGEAFHQALGVDGVILTKLDGDARGGAALSLRQATGQQVRFAGTGERSVDFEVFHADRMASRILGMGDVLTLIERAELGAGQQSIKDVERQIRKGQFTFDDYLAQIRQLRKLGPIEKVMEMLPGAGKFKGQLSGSERDVSKMEAVILSMTKEERAQPQVIDGSRRRRIARGSGTQVADVNRVLKAREMMQQLFKQMGRRGRRGAVPQLPGMF
ncbi:MAG TPA: signal recognition particle protein, partial [Candidatus Dormibacteraeota bacterium]|nr:signal recognition particle protein [Candidatus Dormibacteraeota bacterium]